MGAVLRTPFRQWAMAGRGEGGWPHSEKRHKPGNGGHLKPTILVVEDEVLVRLPIADFLRELEFRVIEASNAEEALAVFRAQEPIEVVFSDINMPGEMNGITLARWIRRNHPDVRILLTSGATPEDEMLPGDSDSPLLEKPYSYDQVAEKIRRLTTL